MTGRTVSGTDGHRRALVVGLGTSGRAAARLLRSSGIEVVLADDATDLDVDDLRAEEFEIVLGGDAAALLDRVDLVVPSPGVPERAPVLRRAVDLGIPIWSEPEVGQRLAPHRLLGVTGTNGKTSTTELITAMLTAAGIPASACGNIGRPVTEAVLDAEVDTVLVAELSSFQLRFVTSLRVEVGVLLNLAEDHLDWHGDLTAYGQAKARLWEGQEPDDWAVTSREDARCRALRDQHARGRHADFSGTAPVERGVGLEGDRLVRRVGSQVASLIGLEELTSRAPHHVANVAAAATVASLAGASDAAIAAAAREYRAGRHRFETVAEIGGVTYVDDSKATNVHAAAAALAGVGDVVWIGGGRAKGVELSALAGALQHTRAAVLIGEAAEQLQQVCAGVGVPAVHAGSIEAAVAAAAARAVPGSTVLLAPACASFDQFRDYHERGERFAAAVRTLARQESR